MTFTPPVNFPEFEQRYPRHVRGYIHRKFHLRSVDLDDAVQDVYVHLLTIPEGSIHAHHPDRISIYRETIPDSEGAFLGFLNLLVRNFMIVKLNRAFRTSSRSVLLSDLAGVDDDPDDENQPENWIDGLQCEGYDSDSGLWFEGILSIAYGFDPRVAFAGAAVAACQSLQEAADSLGMSVGKLSHCLKVLRVIASGDLSTLRPSHKTPRVYRRSKKVSE